MAGIFWHNLSIEEVSKTLNSNFEEGLTEEEFNLRQKEFGKNKLPEDEPLSRLEIFLEQFKSPLVYILVLGGLITLILEEWTDSIVIFSAVFLDTIVGFFQENKASQTLRKLKKTVSYNANVLRDGSLKIINSEELIPGDIIALKSGDKVPADGRLIEAQNLKINEMVLTGEWLAANKAVPLLTKETPLADRDNMVYRGCLVEDGKGRAIVTAIGINTEVGKIAKLLKETKEEQTPYQKKLTRFSKFVSIIITLAAFLIFIEGIIMGRGLLEMFETAIAVAVAAIPEGLPVAMTVILALGMQKVLKKGGLIRRLASAETLGSTSIICTDKTATLTEGKMTVSEIIGDKFWTIKSAALTSESFIENPKEPKEKLIFRGRPTDVALFKAGVERGINREDFEKKRIAELPFNSINKFAAAIFKERKGKFLYVAGAPEKILELSKLKRGKRVSLEGKLEKLTKKGLRVVASGFKKIEKSKIEDIKNEINNLTFAGFITLKDPIRTDVKEAMKTCRQAGMRPIIVTGDHKLTARSVAEDLGFRVKKENILEGKDLDIISDKNFEKILEKIKIYARVEPRHKMKIIEAWQKRGEVVAMTGDGINDAPALKKADVGVALGSGTEVAKEASDLILLNDSFSIIVAAIKEGRGILDNIRKVITYLLFDSFTEVLLIGGSILICWFLKIPWILPITAVQILWTNLVEDGLPDIALAFEPKEKDLMERKPGGNVVPLLTLEMKTLILITGLVDDFFLLGLYFWLLNKFGLANINYIQTMIFAGLSVDTFYVAFCCKSLRHNIWEIDLFSNKFLVVSVLFGILMTVSAIYLPPFQRLLETVPLNANDWEILTILALAEVFLIELTKWYFIKKGLTR